MPLLPGDKLASYEIVSALGAGGMGEVYRATDSRLGRDVALKVLPPEMTNEAGRLERFDREARAIAALNHPHIVTIYSTEEAGGVRFLTMELVDGCTLSDLVISTGMAIPRFLDIAMPLADALAAAHQKQITHRDLKPGNVMVSSDGRVKVLDFGLARLGSSDHGEQTLAETLAPITQQGMLVGTMPYMSPEQVEGRAIDARSDLFSLGVIFYELLSGQRPFKGGSSPALMSAILRDSPPPLGDTRSDIPEALDRLIARLIEKRPEDRLQTARDVFNELKHVRRQIESGTPSRSASMVHAPDPQATSVVVRPFTVKGSDEDSMALADGLTSDITNGLAKFGHLRVVASGASDGARYAVEGTIRRSGNDVRVTVTVIDTRTGIRVWADQLDRAASPGGFALQDDVAARILAAVGDPTGALPRAMAAALAGVAISELSVRELVVRYCAYLDNFRPDEHALLRDAFEQALEREPLSAEGWASLAMLYWQEHTSAFNPLPNTQERQRRAAERAVEVDPHNQQAWLSTASSHRYARDPEAVRAAVERAIRVNPVNADAVALGALHLASCGFYDRALALAARAMDLKPQHPSWYHLTTFAAHFARGEYSEALREAKRISNTRILVAPVGAAAAAGFLGQAADAAPAIAALKRDNPALLDPAAARAAWATRLLDDAVVDQIEEGFRRALELVEAGGAGATISAVKPPSSVSAKASAVRTAGSLAIAVLPLSVRGGDPETEAIAAGLTDDIATSVAKFPGMTIVAAQTTRAFKDSTLDVRQIADRVRARYVITGNLRRSGNTLRTTALLIDARSGEQLWTDTYDRQLGDPFAIQDDLADHIVATVADSHGVLARSMVQSVQSASLHECTNAQLLVRSWAIQHRPTPAFHAELRAELESRLAASPDDAHLWAELASIYIVEHQLWFNPLPDPLGRALNAARRATEVDRLNQVGWQWLAVTQFHLKNRLAFEEARDRALRLNPRNSYTLAWMGAMTTNSGEYERGSAMVERAMAINPAHPGWLHFSVFDRHMVDGDFEQALHAAKRVNMREFFWMYFAIAAACGHLGRAAEGKAAADEMVRLAPFLQDEANLREFVSRWYWSEEMVEMLVKGVLEARSDDRSDDRSDTRSDDRSGGRSKPPSSSASRARAGVTVAVKPFSARSAEPLVPLAEGISEDVATNLARFHYLRVTARAEAARFVVEGSVRSAGSQVRVTARLLDSQSGEHLWAETFDRPSANLFEVQDEVAARIAATMADEDGIIVRALVEPLMGRPPGSLTIDEIVLRYNRYTEQLDSATHAQLTTLLEARLATDPSHAKGWAVLAVLYGQAIMFGFDGPADAVAKQMHAADRAVALNPLDQEGWVALAIKATLARDLAALREATARCVAINPLSGATNVGCALYLALAGDYDRAIEIYRRCKPLIAHHQDWYYTVPMLHAYYTGDYAGALREAQRTTAPAFVGGPIVAASAAAHLGRVSDAHSALDALRRLKPELLDLDAARLYFQAWLWNDADVDALMDGFAKALDGRSDEHPRSIAVLPFADLSEKKDQDWFCDGIAEEIMNALAPLQGLRVAARASAFSFRGKADDLGVIADKLNVATVLDGSVRRSGDRVRITTQLSDARLGTVLWSERFDRELKDIFDVQDEIARAVADRLRLAAAGGMQRIVPKATGSMAAYELLLKGRTFLYRRGPAIVKAIECFEQAIALDTNLADAHAGLGDACRLLGIYGLMPSREAMTRARASLERALAIEPDQVEALATMANIRSAFDWRPEEARALSDRAIALDPGHVRALMESAVTLAVTKKEPASATLDALILDRMRRARALDPLGAWTMAIAALVLVVMDRSEEALELAARAVAADPDNFTAHWARVFTLAKVRRRVEARHAATAGLAMSNRHPVMLDELATLLALDGDRAGAAAIHRELVERAGGSFVGPGSLAITAMAAGEVVEARRYLAEALAERDASITFYKLPAFELLWNDPECAALFQRSELFANRPS